MLIIARELEKTFISPFLNYLSQVSISIIILKYYLNVLHILHIDDDLTLAFCISFHRISPYQL